MQQSQLQTDHKNVRARRVVTGLTPDGLSTIVSDTLSEERFLGDAYAVNMIFRTASLPAAIGAGNGIDEINFRPPPGGFTYMITTFPPDSSYDYYAGYRQSLEGWGANHRPDPADNPAMHTTDTIDIVTILSGELWAILEDAETLLRPGDTLIQHGTKHAWENRSDRDCVTLAVVMSAERKC
jgi:hypothetical protein